MDYTLNGGPFDGGTVKAEWPLEAVVLLDQSNKRHVYVNLGAPPGPFGIVDTELFHTKDESPAALAALDAGEPLVPGADDLDEVESHRQNIRYTVNELRAALD